MKSTSDGTTTNARVLRMMAMLVITLCAFSVAISTVSAGLLDDIPEGFAEGLGMEDPYVAKAILSLMVMASLALALAAAKMKPQGMIIILIIAIGTLTVMGWMDTWVIVLIGILTAALFGKTLIANRPGGW